VTSETLESNVWDAERDVEAVRFSTGRGTGNAWFTADESLVVNELGVWDVATGDLEVPFLGHRGTATISDDGTRAVTAAGGHVALWDTGIRTEVGSVRLPTGGYQTGALVVAAGRAAIVDTSPSVFGEVIVLDLATGEVERRIPDVAGPAVALSADGTRLAVQREPRDDWFGTVEIIDLDSGDVVARMDGLCAWDNHEANGPDCTEYPTPPFAAWVRSLQFTPDGSVLVAGMSDVQDPNWWRAVAWDTATGEILYRSPPSRVAFPILGPDGEYMLLASDHDPWMVDLSDWSTLGEVPVTGYFAHFTTDGSRLITGGRGLRVYDTSTWSERSVETDYRFRDLATAPDASVIATAGRDGFVRVYDLETLELLQMIPIGDEVTNVEFVSDRHLMVVPSTGPGYTVTVDVDELLDIAREQLERSGRSLTLDECARYEIDLCPAG
jgi:WD40 repeat protein